MNVVKPFARRCEVCWQYKEAHVYPLKINGDYKRLCRDCWEKQIAKEEKV